MSNKQIQNVLDNYTEIIYYNEYVNFDGHDRQGPTSKLYDLFVAYRNKVGKIKIDHWHYENWFSKYDILEYSLSKTLEEDEIGNYCLNKQDSEEFIQNINKNKTKN
jgi:hypothetical protein